MVGDFQQSIYRALADERVMHRLVMRQVGAAAVNGLLKIADPAEMPGQRRIGPNIRSCTGGGSRSRPSQEDGKLRRLRVLRFVEEDPKILFPNSRPGHGMLQ